MGEKEETTDELDKKKTTTKTSKTTKKAEKTKTAEKEKKTTSKKKKNEEEYRPTRTVVKAIITGYVGYGILVAIILFAVIYGINCAVDAIGNYNEKVLVVSLPLLEAVAIYFIMHGICKLSVYDFFKKNKTNPENIPTICSRLNLFIIIFTVIYVVGTVGVLNINLRNQMTDITISSYKFSTIYSEEFATKLTNDMLEEFYADRSNTIISTVISELGMVISCFSLIPLQKKLIEKYNEV